MTRQPETYAVYHHRRIRVMQTVTATSQKEAIQKAKDGDWDQFDGEWMEWDVEGDPTRYSAKAWSDLPLGPAEQDALDQHQALMDEQRDAAGPQDDPPW